MQKLFVLPVLKSVMRKLSYQNLEVSMKKAHQKRFAALEGEVIF